MRSFRKRKGLALLLMVCLVIQLTGGVPLGTGNIIAKADDTYDETDTHTDAVTGSAITYLLGGASSSVIYYVGGAGASDSNTGTDTTAPFATLARAVEELNNEPGDYDIIVLGDTAEPRTSTIGDGVNEFNVSIKTVTGSAIVKRNGNVPGDLITVSSQTNLTLGESDDSYTSVLTIDGGRTHFADGVTYGTIIKVNEGASLVTHDRTVIQNVYRWSNYYNKYGGAVYNAGIFDMYGGTIQLCYANYGSGVYNLGTFRLYGGTIYNNERASYGSGVYNNTSGLFEMYGGRISENDGDSYAGGVYNAGIFRLYDGSIDSNYANSNGGVYNSYTGTIYMTGGAIDNNRSDYSSAGIYNSGIFHMSGGSISENTCTDRGGGIFNYGFLDILGGTIENNVAERGGAIYGTEESELLISGGIIRNNTAAYGGAVYSEGTLNLSGNAQIPAGIDDMNNIHLLSPLTIMGDITFTDSYSIVLDNYSYSVGDQWIRGTTGELISDNISKFILANNKYSFDNNGYVLSNASHATYYVGGENASDTNDGTQDNPFATLDYAFEIGNDARSTFILQSDQILTKAVNIKGDITLISDGLSRTVSKSPGFSDDYMFRVESGTLTLGNNDLDSSDLLIFDGLDESTYYGFLLNEASVNIYNGVTIKNFNNHYCIVNLGTLNMYGGSIEYNSVDEFGIIYNMRNLYMNGGYIRFNIGSGVFNNDVEIRDECPESEPEIYMSGGSIYGNIAEIGSAIYNKTGNIVVSGSVAFSMEGDLHNEIYIQNLADLLTIGGELNTQDQIIIGGRFYYDGQQVLGGEASLLRSNYTKFRLTNPDFSINEQGIVRDSYSASVYYVHSSGDDFATGSIDDPLATIHKAIQMIGTEKGTIIIQSDITIDQSVVVTGDVTIQSDGNVRNIYRGESFTRDEELSYDMSDCMFYVSGKLSLGNIDGNDLNPDLFINANGDLGEVHIDAIIKNHSKLELYPGVVLHNNISERSSTAVISFDDFHMYGGSICDNESDEMNGVYVAIGTFTMDGGTISNNVGRDSGVIVMEGTFIMNGGSITENTAIESGAGVLAMSSNITINSGNISRNVGIYSGITLQGSELYINGGNIEENTGMSAGIYGLMSCNISISGGNIRNNNGTMASGVLIGVDSVLNFSGGRIGGNSGDFIQGIFVDESTRLSLSGSAMVEADNKIILQKWNTESKIMLNGPLTSDVTAIIDIFRLDMNEEMDYTQEFTLGSKLIEPSGGYYMSWNDVSRLVLADNDFAINTSGIIGKAIKEAWVSPIGSEVYSGREKTPHVVVKDGDTVLTIGVDYLVRYRDNISTGQATVVIAGIGGYGGVIETHFSIYKATATRILTPMPLDKSFSASLHMTESELLESITLKHVEVAHLNGTAWLPVEWKMTQGSYNPQGGTYIYTGTVLSDDSIDSNGLTLTMRINVEPFEPYLSETFGIGDDKEENLSIIYRKDGNNLYAEFFINEEAFSGDDKVVIPISTDELLKQIKSDDMENAIISLTIPGSILDAEGSDIYSLLLDDELVRVAKEAGRDITISIKDENGMERYSWTFRGEDLQNSSNEDIETELGLSIRKLGELESANNLEDNGDDQEEVNDLEDNEEGETGVGFVISFGHSGNLPSQASVRIYVGDREGVKPGDRIYLYYYNSDTDKLVTLPGGYGYLVDDEGYISVDILHCSDYVVLYEEAGKEQIISLRDQIKVTLEDSIIYIGVKNKPNETHVNIGLPVTLELVESLEDETSQSAIGGVTASYQSSNESVAIVDEKGVITAKGKGTSTITTKVTLYNGKVKTVRTVVIVRNR